MAGWTYIMTDRPYGMLYVGVTCDLPQRLKDCRAGRASRFCKTFDCTRLVWAEPHATFEGAIARERSLKYWCRTSKHRLVSDANPGWADLSETIAQEGATAEQPKAHSKQ